MTNFGAANVLPSHRRAAFARRWRDATRRAVRAAEAAGLQTAARPRAAGMRLALFCEDRSGRHALLLRETPTIGGFRIMCKP
jgi:hypothetical protein